MHRSRKSPHAALFRGEIRAFIARRRAPELSARSASAPDRAAWRPWQAALLARGWAAPAWPARFGGAGWSAWEVAAWNEETARAHLPPSPTLGVDVVGPLLIAHGAPAQQARFLPDILSGAAWWGAALAHPDADAPTFRRAAGPSGDERFVLDGAVRWVAHADLMDYLLVAACEAPSPGPPSLFALPLGAPGVALRRLPAVGPALFEIAVTDVVLEGACLIGEVGAGADLIAFLERPSQRDLAKIPRLRRAAARALAHARGDRDLERRGAELQIDLVALDACARRIALLDRTSPLDGRLLRLQTTRLEQRLAELALAVAGYGALASEDGPPLPGSNLPPRLAADPPGAARMYFDALGGALPGARERLYDDAATAILEGHHG
ncbi:MAG: acyl-CoA dehydrogenase family protein [Caulobacteraceae bacterium]|nr:acyl-CoA dehydrogenase family protein [Caulobacteraceae bacterium]